MVVGNNVLPTQHSMKYVQSHTVDEHISGGFGCMLDIY